MILRRRCLHCLSSGLESSHVRRGTAELRTLYAVFIESNYHINDWWII